jgi:hypothetical protein
MGVLAPDREPVMVIDPSLVPRRKLRAIFRLLGSSDV